MKNRIRLLFSVIVTMMFCLSIVSSAGVINHTIKHDILSKNTNKQIYLGYAKITGNGSNCILKAAAENNLIVDIENKTSYVDFYINYSMNCSGVKDTGYVSLELEINDRLVMPNIVSTEDYEAGILKYENIKVNKSDSFYFDIIVIYLSMVPIPNYHNFTDDPGSGKISRSIKYNNCFNSIFLQVIYSLVNRFHIFGKILNQII